MEHLVSSVDPFSSSLSLLPLLLFAHFVKIIIENCIIIPNVMCTITHIAVAYVALIQYLNMEFRASFVHALCCVSSLSHK